MTAPYPMTRRRPPTGTATTTAQPQPQPQQAGINPLDQTQPMGARYPSRLPGGMVPRRLMPQQQGQPQAPSFAGRLPGGGAVRPPLLRRPQQPQTQLPTTPRLPGNDYGVGEHPGRTLPPNRRGPTIMPPPPPPEIPPPPPPIPDPYGGTPITGREQPGLVLPGEDPLEAMLPDIMERLDAKPWDEETFTKSMDAATGRAEALLAERGTNWSESEAPKVFGNALLPLLEERQRMADTNRRFDLDYLSGLGRDRSDLAYRGRNERRGERGYLDDLDDKAREQAIEEALLGEGSESRSDSDYLRWTLPASNQGDEGIGAIGGAMGGYGGAAGGYGRLAEGYGDDAGGLLELLGYYYGDRV